MESNIKVQNLKCGGCANSIKNTLEKLKGITNVVIDVKTAEVSIEHSDAVNLGDIEEKLNRLGYPKVNAINNMSAKAKSYISCGLGRFYHS